MCGPSRTSSAASQLSASRTAGAPGDPSLLGDGDAPCRRTDFPLPVPSKTRDRRSQAIPRPVSHPRSARGARKGPLSPRRRLRHVQSGPGARSPGREMIRSLIHQPTLEQYDPGTATGASRCLSSVLPFSGLFPDAAERGLGMIRPGGTDAGFAERNRQSDEPAVDERVLRRLEGALNRLPARIAGSGATPRGRGQGCENTPVPEPVPGPRTGGSLPSTAQVTTVPRPIVRSSRKTLPNQRIRRLAGVNHRSAKMCIDPPCRMHTSSTA